MPGGGTATFRFYGELNDFLPAARRQTQIPYGFSDGQSVKDAIEALGVPHTEVVLVTADGAAVPFGHHLNDHERVAVYPAFAALDPGGATARPPVPRPVRFVADVHLGTLARHLRLLGFDTRFDPTAGDEELAATAHEEARVLLTRDHGLLKRRIVTWGRFVRSDHPIEQAVDVVRHLELLDDIRPFGRCLECNGMPAPVPEEQIEHRLEPLTRKAFREFRLCPGCDRIYWKGSHHDRLAAVLDEIRYGAARPPDEDDFSTP
jgi:uncharacterized protein with PIN domain